MTNTNQNRTNRVAIRLSDAERKAIQEAANKAKRTFSDYVRLTILENIEKEMGKMNNLEGKKWGELTGLQKQELMGKARVWEDVVGECIIDFEGMDLSVCGFNESGEEEIVIIIDDNDKLYNPNK